MFKCQICNKSSRRYERPVMFVVETRDKEYPERPGIYNADDGEYARRDDPGGWGTEIVKEIKIHVECMPDTAPTNG